MTGAELKQIIDELKAEGNSEDDILAGFYQMYKNGDFDEEDLEVAVNFLGYRLSDEFKAMSDDEKKKLDEEEFEEEGAEEGAAQEEQPQKEEKEDKAMNEDLKTFGDQKEEKPAANENAGKEEAPKQDENQEEDERQRARKLFGFDK